MRPLSRVPTPSKASVSAYTYIDSEITTHSLRLSLLTSCMLSDLYSGFFCLFLMAATSSRTSAISLMSDDTPALRNPGRISFSRSPLPLSFSERGGPNVTECNFCPTGAHLSFARHSPLVQSTPLMHFRPSSHRGHPLLSSPPQSMSDSPKLCSPSLQVLTVGALVGVAVAGHWQHFPPISRLPLPSEHLSRGQLAVLHRCDGSWSSSWSSHGAVAGQYCSQFSDWGADAARHCFLGSSRSPKKQPIWRLPYSIDRECPHWDGQGLGVTQVFSVTAHWAHVHLHWPFLCQHL